VGDGTNNGTKFTSEGSLANTSFTLLYTQDLGLNKYPLSSSTGVFDTAATRSASSTALAGARSPS
jgi:hypothetical protein